MESNSDNLSIVQAIVQLGSSLGLSITAEGVETEEQAVLLKSLGCGNLQGYLYSRPVPPALLSAAPVSNIAGGLKRPLLGANRANYAAAARVAIVAVASLTRASFAAAAAAAASASGVPAVPSCRPRSADASDFARYCWHSERRDNR